MDNCLDHSSHQRAIRTHDERLASHGGDIDKLRECVVRLTALQEAQKLWQADADERIAALEAKPARRLEHVGNYAITAVISLTMGFLAAQIGLS